MDFLFWPRIQRMQFEPDVIAEASDTWHGPGIDHGLSPEQTAFTKSMHVWIEQRAPGFSRARSGAESGGSHRSMTILQARHTNRVNKLTKYSI
jgi:hypothetical protein